MELSIVMPCLNEAETLGVCIKKAQSFLSKNHIDGEVIIADNGSTDDSIQIANSLNAKIIHVETKGYGSALKGGFEAAKGKYIIMGDADDSYDFSALEPFLKELRHGHQLVMGNRFKGGIEKGAMPFLHKYLGNPVLSFLGRLFFSINIGDFHCGLRGFSRDAFKDIDLRTTGMEFASEMIVKAKLNNLSIFQVPTILSKDGRSRDPHLNTWNDGWRHLRFLLLYSPKWLFLIPGIFAMFFGLILSLFLLYSPITINEINLDIHTLLYSSTMIIIGFQFIVFYGLTKVFAIENGLLPKSNRYQKLFNYLNLERGLLIGFILLIFGFIKTIQAYLGWQETHFGNLNPKQTFRIVIPAILSIQMGMQIILFSFFFSVLGLKNEKSNI